LGKLVTESTDDYPRGITIEQFRAGGVAQMEESLPNNQTIQNII
jgi:hypothetical protein